MKTSKTYTGKNTLTSLTMIIALTFGLTSCQKDDLATTTPAQSSVSDNASRTNTINFQFPQAVRPYAMLQIDHLAIKSMSSDYSITIYSDGTAMFSGRKNVTAIGEFQLDVSRETINMIDKMIQESNFFSMTTRINNTTQDLPMTVTTYTKLMAADASVDAASNFKTKSLVDYNNGAPANLVSLRTKIETLLNLNKLIGK